LPADFSGGEWEMWEKIIVAAIGAMAIILAAVLNNFFKERSERRAATVADKKERDDRQRKKDDQDDLIRQSLGRIEKHNAELDKLLADLRAEIKEVRGQVKEIRGQVKGNNVVQVEVVRSLIDGIHEKCKQKHSIDKHTLDQVQELWSLYQEKGGNGYVEALVKELTALPLEK
jgi:septal ring factor EnvC (AmiA/AmiB activator)